MNEKEALRIIIANCLLISITWLSMRLEAIHYIEQPCDVSCYTVKDASLTAHAWPDNLNKLCITKNNPEKQLSMRIKLLPRKIHFALNLLQILRD